MANTKARTYAAEPARGSPAASKPPRLQPAQAQRPGRDQGGSRQGGPWADPRRGQQLVTPGLFLSAGVPDRQMHGDDRVHQQRVGAQLVDDDPTHPVQVVPQSVERDGHGGVADRRGIRLPCFVRGVQLRDGDCRGPGQRPHLAAGQPSSPQRCVRSRNRATASEPCQGPPRRARAACRGGAVAARGVRRRHHGRTCDRFASPSPGVSSYSSRKSSSSVGGWTSRPVAPAARRAATTVLRLLLHPQADADAAAGQRMVLAAAHAGHATEGGQWREQARLHRGQGVGAQVCQRAAADRAPTADDADPIAQRLDLPQDVAGQQHRAASSCGLANTLGTPPPSSGRSPPSARPEAAARRPRPDRRPTPPSAGSP